MSRASKILSHSDLDLFSSGDFCDPLNNGGEDRGLSFSLWWNQNFSFRLSKATKSRTLAKAVTHDRHASPSSGEFIISALD